MSTPWTPFPTRSRYLSLLLSLLAPLLSAAHSQLLLPSFLSPCPPPLCLLPNHHSLLPSPYLSLSLSEEKKESCLRGHMEGEEGESRKRDKSNERRELKKKKRVRAPPFLRLICDPTRVKGQRRGDIGARYHMLALLSRCLGLLLLGAWFLGLHIGCNG